MVGQTRPGRPGPQKSWILSVPDLSPKRPGFFKPVPDGSFPSIVVKHTRQVIRIEVMRADLLDLNDGLFLDLLMSV